MTDFKPIPPTETQLAELFRLREEVVKLTAERDAALTNLKVEQIAHLSLTDLLEKENEQLKSASDQARSDYEREHCRHVVPMPDALQTMIDEAVAAERIKHQAEIQRLTALAQTAEKWRGIAMSRDGGGRTVQQVQEEARAAEREACALVAEGLVRKQHKHINGGRPFTDHMHWEDIALAIRARGQS